MVNWLHGQKVIELKLILTKRFDGKMKVIESLEGGC